MAAQQAFFAPTITGIALQSRLFDALSTLEDLPRSGRFGSHYLLIPLLHVNKHFRTSVAKYLYSLVYGQKHKHQFIESLSDYEHLLCQQWQLYDELYSARNDPRYNLSGGRIGVLLDAQLRMYAARLDVASIELDVVFNKSDNPLNVLAHVITESASGRQYSDVPSAVTIISTAAFQRGVQRGREAYGTDAAAPERFGLRPSVPISNPAYCVDVETGMFPEWPSSASPTRIVKKDEEWQGWTLSYTTKLHDVEDFRAEEHCHIAFVKQNEKQSEEERSKYLAKLDAEYERKKGKDERVRDRARYKKVAIRFQEIRVPLLQLLRARVDKVSEVKSYYRNYDNTLDYEYD